MRLVSAFLVAFLMIGSAAGADSPVFWVRAKANDHSDNQSNAVTEHDMASIGRSEIRTVIPMIDEKEHVVSGVLLRDVLAHNGAKGSLISVYALDNYAVDIPVSDATNYDVLVADQIDGKQLTTRDKGPAWIIYPLSQHPELLNPVYDARSIWQVKTIEIIK